MQDFEKLGVFYLGRRYDPAQGRALEEPLLYDARDLVTHALCVGMTGSGKTGLVVSLLEEAAIDGIPAIALDPKGDLANLALLFPELRPEDFRPWIEESEAARAGKTPDEHARATAELWRKGLADWGQAADRIARLRDAVDLAIYTPGSSAGLSLSLLKSFTPPPPALLADEDALRERVQGTVSGLLGLLGIEADPLQSREHILFSLLLERAWRAGRALSLAELVRLVQTPPIEQVGVLDLETFFPSKERGALALALNNLLASPGFAAWSQGEALDVQRLLWTPDGKPRLSILSIAHLSDAERMFFVTLLLEELVGWMRAQSGTSSLRALFAMDEIFGYFPPSANPPSKTPLLTLLKQARAFGLGCLLATQNPVDLDYKGLANCGTWFLGRLQTERDKLRVLDGLEGATAASGAAFDRASLERTLSALGKRVFLMHDVHEDAPCLFQTRWALSFLRGPLTKAQIQKLMAPRKAAAKAPAATEPAAAGAAPVAPAASSAAPATTPSRAPAASAAAESAARAPSRSEPVASSDAPSDRPVLPPEVTELFALATVNEGELVYRPHLLGTARLHFADAKSGVDVWRSVALLAPLELRGNDVWQDARDFEGADALLDEGLAGARFAPLPPEALRAKTYGSWAKSLAQHLYQRRTLPLLACPALKLVARPDESRADFFVRVRQAAREQRDGAVAKLQAKYAPKLATLEQKVRRLQERVRRESSQYEQQKSQSMISIGSTLLGALFGRKLASSGNVGRATTAARGVSRAAREREDIASAESEHARAKDELLALEARFQTEAATLGAVPDPESLGLVELALKPRKSDITVESVALVWMA